ncbi:hypothetical protein V8D89_011192 [Ganoderma adspersum]
MQAERAARSNEPGTFKFTAYNEFHAPLRLAAPEAIRGSPHPYSPPINIWAVGHLLFQCLTGSELVLTSRIDGECAGPDFPHFGEPPRTLPRTLQVPSLEPSSIFGHEVNGLCNPHALEERLRSFAHVDEEMSDGDMQATCALLSRCFEPDPAARPTARQLLEDRWFRS